ncbi:MAG: response regulator [Aureliella sp.]
MSNPRVIDVGNCPPDYAAIKRMLETRFQAKVEQAHSANDAVQLLKSAPADLVLINRKLDRDYSDGTEVLKQIKADPDTSSVPVMLVTNYAEHQQAAIQLGAIEGFGKLSLEAPETIARLSDVLQG